MTQPTWDEIEEAIKAGRAIVCYAKCESCQCNSHPGGWHTWAGPDDIEHAKATSQPDPTTGKCGCWCADGPKLEPEPDSDPLSLDMERCPICGEEGACAYDSEGRALIHSEAFEDET
jgi:hypothetical protein